jgi:hypothetical protein
MYKRRPCHFHFRHNTLENYISFGLKFFPYLGNSHSLSLMLFWMLVTCLLEGSGALSLLDAFLLLCGGIYLVKRVYLAISWNW